MDLSNGADWSFVLRYLGELEYSSKESRERFVAERGLQSKDSIGDLEEEGIPDGIMVCQ